MDTPTASYDQILAQVLELELDNQLKLLEELATLLRRHMGTRPKSSILELQGLGKEIWEGIDAQKYVDKERASWNG